MLCISYSSSAVMKHHEQDHVQQEGFTWGLQFPSYKHPLLSWWQIDITLEQPLRVHILIHWEEAKNTLELSPLNLKASSQRHIFPKWACLLIFPKKVPSNIQTYKPMWFIIIEATTCYCKSVTLWTGAWRQWQWPVTHPLLTSSHYDFLQP